MNLPAINIQLDFRSEVPIYAQITAHIRQMIASGALKAGDQLPTVRQLAAELRINFNTVARAYRMLDESGLISTQQGRGTYIWAGGDGTDLEELDRKSLEKLAEVYLVETARLGFSSADAVEALQRKIEEKTNPS